MGRKRHTPEQIITALREAEVGLARGKSVKLISRELGSVPRFVCKSGGSSSPSARLLGRPPVSGGVRGRGNAGRPRRVWS